MEFRSSPIARDRIERGQMAISARNACHEEKLERYKNTLEKQRKRETSLLLFQREKFMSRQERILGKSFHSRITQRESKHSEFPRATLNRIVTERKMSADSSSTRNKSVEIESKKPQSERSSSACGKLNEQSNEKTNDDVASSESKNAEKILEEQAKEVQHSVNTREEILKIKSLEISTKEILESPSKQNKFNVLKNENKEVPEKCLLRESSLSAQMDKVKNRRQGERFRSTSRKSLSLPEIICPSKLKSEDCPGPSDSTSECKITKKVKKSKKNHATKKHQTKKRMSRPLAKFSSLPDVRTNTADQKTCDNAKARKYVEKPKRECGLTFPHVTRRHTDAKPSKTEASVNWSVVCGVIRIKNTLTKRKRCRKEKEKTVARKELEITPEEWESLKNCRYLRTKNTDITREVVY